MADMLDEISDEVQQEKVAKFITKNWLYFVLILALVITSIIVILAFNDRKTREYEQLGSLYYQALNNEQKEQVDIALFDKIIKKQKSGYYFLASLEKASLLVKDKKIKKAVNLYDDLASTKNIDKSIKYLAQLLAVSTLIESDAEEANLIDKRIEQIVKKDNPFYASSLMTKINWLIKNNKNEEAKTSIDLLIMAEKAPANLKEIAKILAKKN